MSVKKSLYVGGLATVMASALMAAKPQASGTDSETTPRKGHARLTKPWNELKDLTDDEKTKIIEVHQKAVDEMHEIEAKEHKDIMALLTDSQKKEVEEIEAKDKEAAKAGRTHRSTTQPSAEAK